MPTWNDTPSTNNIIHGATGAWVEHINTTHFTTCAKTSYIAEHHGERTSVNFMVYQKNLKYQTDNEMEAGEPIVLPNFSDSSGCANVTDLDVSALMYAKVLVLGKQ